MPQEKAKEDQGGTRKNQEGPGRDQEGPGGTREGPRRDQGWTRKGPGRRRAKEEPERSQGGPGRRIEGQRELLIQLLGWDLQQQGREDDVQVLRAMVAITDGRFEVVRQASKGTSLESSKVSLC
ncbi:hypothetical protein EV424DRAFT_1557861 [Suillus variegatus]|nr:hypothetical protein EV424DRAFT_1557861 [Suillus variegatus]